MKKNELDVPVWIGKIADYTSYVRSENSMNNNQRSSGQECSVTKDLQLTYPISVVIQYNTDRGLCEGMDKFVNVLDAVSICKSDLGLLSKR